MIEKHRNVSWRNKKRPFGKSVLCHPGYCRMKWGRGRAFKIETIKVGREALLKSRGVKIQKSICAVFDQIVWRLRHRYKERCANMQRRPEAKHCSSLCSQSEGDEYCGGQARAENTTNSCPGALVMFATCSWPSLCEQSELQCWRRNRRLCGPVPLQGRVFKIQKNLCAFFLPNNKWQSIRT